MQDLNTLPVIDYSAVNPSEIRAIEMNDIPWPVSTHALMANQIIEYTSIFYFA